MPVALLTRTVANYPTLDTNGTNGYALVRYQNVQGAFSLTSLTFQDLPQPPPPFPSNTYRAFACAWRAMVVIRSFPASMDAFGRAIPRRRYGYYSAAYADLYSSLHYINFSKQLTEYYNMFAFDGTFPSWADNFPPPFPPANILLPGMFMFANNNNSRIYATQIKGELGFGVVADIYISAFYFWQLYNDTQTLLFVDA